MPLDRPATEVPAAPSGTLVRVEATKLRSPLARAVVPVAAGIGFFAVLGLILWGVAVFLSNRGEDVRLGDNTFQVGRIDKVADSIRADGPQTFQDLKGTSATRSVIVDHVGDVDAAGWVIYNPFPADRSGSDCFVRQEPAQRGTRSFTDCDGRVLDVSQLRQASDVRWTVEGGKYLTLVFQGATPATTTVTTATTGSTSPATTG